MKRPAPTRIARGFGMIECLMVVALGAALAAMALPMSSALGQRLQRAQARTALAQAAWWMEREASLSGTYPTQIDAIAGLGTGLSYRLGLGWMGNGYVLSATPIGQQARDACGVLWLNQAGERGSDGATSACW